MTPVWLESFPQVSHEPHAQSTFESKLRRTLLTHYLCSLVCLVLLVFSTIHHVILPSGHFNKILQTTQQPQNLGRSSSRPSCRIWTVWASDGREWYCLYSMPFRIGFWALGLIFDCLFKFLKKVKALQRTLGYYHGHSCTLFKLIVIHVYKHVHYCSHTGRPGAVQYLSVECISLRYVFGKLIHVLISACVTLAMVPHAN